MERGIWRNKREKQHWQERQSERALWEAKDGVEGEEGAAQCFATCYSRCHLFQLLLISARTYLLGRKLNIDLFFSLHSHPIPIFYSASSSSFFFWKDHHWLNFRCDGSGLSSVRQLSQTTWELAFSALKLILPMACAILRHFIHCSFRPVL